MQKKEEKKMTYRKMKRHINPASGRHVGTTSANSITSNINHENDIVLNSLFIGLHLRTSKIFFRRRFAHRKIIYQ